MRIFVLGATGRTGRPFVQRALAGGHEAVAYVRRPDALAAQPGLTVVGGDLGDTDAMTAALRGCDAVLVALGPAGERPVTVMRTALPTVTAAMEATGARRIVVLSALGVGPTLRQSPWAGRVIARTLAREIYADHDAAESALVRRGLDWTLVHPGRLVDGPARGGQALDLAGVDRVRGVPRISYVDLSRVLLDVVTDPATIGRRLYAG